jgi:hypothetical protein
MKKAGRLTTCNPRKRVSLVEMMLDWGVHGRRLKLVNQQNNGYCPICMAPDSQHYILYQCSHEVANQHSNKWKKDMEAVIRSHITIALGKTAQQQRHTKEQWEALRELTTHSGWELIRKGLWSSYMWEVPDGLIWCSRYPDKKIDQHIQAETATTTSTHNDQTHLCSA